MEVLCGSRVNLVSGCLTWLKRSGLLEATAISYISRYLGETFQTHIAVNALLKTLVITHTQNSTPENWGWQLSEPHWSSSQGNLE